LNELYLKYNVAIPRTLLYYHLGELEKMNIIQMAGYRDTGRGGAPEKMWRASIKKIVVDVTTGRIYVE